MDWTTETVTLVNRTSQPLVVTFDGKTITLGPHQERHVPPIVADKACQQHPVMGTEDPSNPRDFQMLVGVREWGHDCSPIEQSDAAERLDPTLLPPDKQRGRQVVSSGRRGYSRRAQVADSLSDPDGSRFTGDRG